MKTTERNEAALPTGFWLAHERQRLGKTLVDVANAVQGHHATIRAVEQNDCVLPPGWYPNLRMLGMRIYEPLWPQHMQPYCGADLQSDLQTRAGFRHSRYWLSKQLCVPERAVTDVIRDNLPVTHSWLLKLAELGADVPAPVMRTFLRNASESYILPASTPAAANQADAAGPSSRDALVDQLIEKVVTAPRSFDADPPRDPKSQPKESFGPARPEPPSPSVALPLNTPQAPVEEPAPAAARRESESFYMHWTEQGGLHFSISASLLEQIPGALKGLLILLAQSSPNLSKPGPSAPTART